MELNGNWGWIYIRWINTLMDSFLNERGVNLPNLKLCQYALSSSEHGLRAALMKFRFSQWMELIFTWRGLCHCWKEDRAQSCSEIRYSKCTLFFKSTNKRLLEQKDSICTTVKVIKFSIFHPFNIVLRGLSYQHFENVFLLCMFLKACRHRLTIKNIFKKITLLIFVFYSGWSYQCSLERPLLKTLKIYQPQTLEWKRSYIPSEVIF